MTTTTRALLDAVPQVGRVEWIGLRSERRGAVHAVEEAQAVAGLGLEGDHHTRGRRPDPAGKRHVTLIQAEHLPVIAGLAGVDVAPAQSRRNLVVSGINLRSLERRRFRIGDALLEGTGACHPCSRMEETIGPGGFQAMRGHGGITARVLASGTVRVGAPVAVVSPPGGD